jgi:hypothetical protein
MSLALTSLTACCDKSVHFVSALKRTNTHCTLKFPIRFREIIKIEICMTQKLRRQNDDCDSRHFKHQCHVCMYVSDAWNTSGVKSKKVAFKWFNDQARSLVVSVSDY